MQYKCSICSRKQHIEKQNIGIRARDWLALMNEESVGQMVSPAYQSESDGGARLPSLRDLLPDPRQMWAVFRRNLLYFLIAFVLTVAVIIGWTASLTPLYSATASLLVVPKEDQVVDVKAVSPDLPQNSDVVDTKVRLMNSPDLARTVAQQYAATTGLPTDKASIGDLADRLKKQIDIARVGATYVIDVNAKSTSAKEAASVANLWVSQFVQSERDAKLNANQKADDWLRSRAAELEQDAKAADQALQQYRIQYGLLTSDSSKTMAEQEISNLDQQVAQAEAELAERQGRLSAARNQMARGGGGADVGAALGSGTIGSLRSREAALSAEVAQLESTYGPRYPDLIKSKSELSAIRTQIQKEINRILSNLSADVQVASSRLASLKASRRNSTSTLANNNAAQVGLLELERKAEAAKAVYQRFLNRLHETSAQQGLQQADSRVAQQAFAPKQPFQPNWMLALVFAPVAGLAAGLLTIGCVEYLQGGLRTRTDVERRLKVRYAGAVPDLQSTLDGIRATEPPHEYLLSRPHSAFTESLRNLRAFLLLGNQGQRRSPRALAITSALPQEGKTTTSVCLARTSALSGVPTVLIDCDLRRRGASELVLPAGHTGLYEYLDGSKSLEEALYFDEPSGLFVLGATVTPEDMIDPLNADVVSNLITELKKTFNVIVIDTAPVLGVADSRIVAACADRVLMIARWNSTPLRACDLALNALLDVSAKVSGVALTKVDVKKYAGSDDIESYAYDKKLAGYYRN